jgi:hypothetical protein
MFRFLPESRSFLHLEARLLRSTPATVAGCPTSPDFLCTFVGSLNFLRLSLMKGAYAVLSGAAYRKFGGISLVFREMWDTADLALKPPRSPQLRRGAPCSHQRFPDFLLRSTRRARVCGFLSKKAAWTCSKPPTSTGNPGYVGRKRWAKPHQSLSFRPPPLVHWDRSAGRISARFVKPGANPAACSSSISAPPAGQPPDCVPEFARRCRGEAQSPWSRCWSA